MRGVLVTHADEPIGRRVVKVLVRDARVGAILAVGEGEPPRALDALLARDPPRVYYQRADLVRYRTVSLLFRSPLVRDLPIDVVVHVPRHAASVARGAAGVSEPTGEARLVLHGCLQQPAIRRLIAVGSSFVYRLAPGNANRLCETSELDLGPDVADPIRTWIDCDMLFQSALHQRRLAVVLLRAATVVAADGGLYLCPLLAGPFGPLRALGFDPLVPLVSDKDVARAVQCAVHARVSGVYNVAGHESVPFSQVLRWTGRSGPALPGPLLSAVSSAAGRLGRRRAGAPAAALRYGCTLDTARAERELGFRPAYRIGAARDAGRRVEVYPA